MIHHFVEHRHEVVIRRTEYDLAEAEKRAHILEGLLKALDHLDEVIAIIRGSKDPDTARAGLMETFEFSEAQSTAILNMRLQRLTGLERDKLQAEFDELMKQIEYFKQILADEGLRMQIIKDELIEIKEKYGDDRRSQIVVNADDLMIEDMIPNEEMVLTISHHGYIKRTPLKEYKMQNRGGVGARGVSTKQDDFTEHLFIASSHNYLLIFTQQGKVFWMKVYQVPEGGKTSKGRPLPNMISIDQDDKVMAVINVITLKDEDYINNNFLVMSTKRGLVKKTSLEAYSRPRQNGINAININEGDELLDVKLTNGNNDIIIAARSGKACRFHESDVRAMGRTATGVRGIRLASDEDEVIGMVCIEDRETNLLVVSEKGYGKRSEVEDYRITKRGGKGVKAMKVTEKTGELAAIKNVTDLDELMIINKSGVTIRMAISQLRVMGRATQGVRLIKLSANDEISSVAKIEGLEEIEEVLGEEVVEQIVENQLPADEIIIRTDEGEIDTEEEQNDEDKD